jgi:Ca2+-binding RTX toxin-like protein
VGTGDRIDLYLGASYNLTLAAISGVERLAFAGGSGGTASLSGIQIGTGQIASVTGDGGVNTLNVTGAVVNLSGVTFSGWTNGTDIVNINGTAGVDNLLGSNQNDVITGGNGNDRLNGGVGADIMLGGANNDTYVVDNVGDQVFETTTTSTAINAGGTDTVLTSITFNLSTTAGRSFIERLTLTGVGEINGTGNALANLMIGNAGKNVLNGGLGNDIMVGGAGNDIYVVDAAGDRVFETTTTTSIINAGGDDKVNSAVTFSLDNSAGVRFIERLTLTGTNNTTGVGNALANVLIGNSGNNTLYGGLGNDTLTGGAGNDTFVFNTPLGPTNIDRITDFSVADDRMRLDDAIFNAIALGTLANTAFVANTTGLATTIDHRIIYETDTGRLFYDSDGLNGLDRVQFATVAINLALTNADFSIF